MTRSVEENIRVVSRFFDLLGGGDFEGAIGAFAEDAVMWVPGTLPLSGTFRGRTEIAEKNFNPSKQLTAENSFSVDVLHVTGEGDDVAVEWIVRRKTPKGRDYENHFYGMFRVRDGMISEFREYPDTQYAHEALFT